ncbi:hypothetical protein [uncultured Methanobrevibacter sp.]|uniref:hypothetical protein n=1 Tax=uncultured Methanobrevibacter sp. TaxID=253161 RepID=UPI0025FDD016|nr:hypothetical protein [uncultured Methanobrevibacter sp.]
MCMNLENDDCGHECKDCVYYFEETDFCLHTMYNVMRVVKDCENKRSREDYPASTLISDEDLEFSDELTDCRDGDMTISELYDELKAITREALDY